VNDKILIKLIEKLSIDFFTFTFTYLFAQVLCFVDLQENKIREFTFVTWIIVPQVASSFIKNPIVIVGCYSTSHLIT
jgi:hypothetical protein